MANTKLVDLVTKLVDLAKSQEILHELGVPRHDDQDSEEKNSIPSPRSGLNCPN